MGAVGGAEGVVDVDVGEARRAPSASSGSFFGLAGLVAAVLEQQHLAAPQPPAAASTSAPDHAGRGGDVGADQLAEPGGDRRHRELGLAVLRAAEVRDQDDRGAALAQQLDRRQRGPDPGVVGDPRPPSESATLKSTRTSTRAPVHRGVADARLRERPSPGTAAQAAARAGSSTFAASSTKRFE